LWTGAVSAEGYGVVHAKSLGIRKQMYAHRLSHELFIGPVPPGLQIDHRCRVRCCVNPQHIKAVTQIENILRGTSPAADHARKTHCPKGHAYDSWNTRRERARGKRHCIACQQTRRAA
jgi:hypothetical protein